MSAAERLYTPDMLALAVRLAEFPLTDDLPLTGSARSKTCGSTLTMGLATDAGGTIRRVGMRAAACAVGQAAAAIFAVAAPGRSESHIAAALIEIERWQAGNVGLPGWPGFATIAAARDFPGRHGAMKLPWEAALAALSSAGASD